MKDTCPPLLRRYAEAWEKAERLKRIANSAEIAAKQAEFDKQNAWREARGVKDGIPSLKPGFYCLNDLEGILITHGDYPPVVRIVSSDTGSD